MKLVALMLCLVGVIGCTASVTAVEPEPVERLLFGQDAKASWSGMDQEGARSTVSYTVSVDSTREVPGLADSKCVAVFGTVSVDEIVGRASAPPGGVAPAVFAGGVRLAMDPAVCPNEVDDPNIFGLQLAESADAVAWSLVLSSPSGADIEFVEIGEATWG